MTPTFASKVAESAKHADRSPTPVSVKSTKNERSNAFLRSAVKRVGFRRSDGTPHSKKGDILRHDRVVAIPDKVNDSKLNTMKC